MEMAAQTWELCGSGMTAVEGIQVSLPFIAGGAKQPLIHQTYV